MIGLFIDVAIEMHNLRNFAGLSSVITALCIDMVARLKESWAFVPKDMVDRLQVSAQVWRGVAYAAIGLVSGVPVLHERAAYELHPTATCSLPQCCPVRPSCPSPLRTTTNRTTHSI